MVLGGWPVQDSGNQGLNRVGQGSGKARFREPGFGHVLGIVKNRCQEPRVNQVVWGRGLQQVLTEPRYELVVGDTNFADFSEAFFGAGLTPLRGYTCLCHSSSLEFGGRQTRSFQSPQAGITRYVCLSIDLQLIHRWLKSPFGS